MLRKREREGSELGVGEADQAALVVKGVTVALRKVERVRRKVSWSWAAGEVELVGGKPAVRIWRG